MTTDTRQRLHGAIETEMRAFLRPTDEDTEEVTAGLCTGWVVVATFVDSQGSEWIGAECSEGLPSWTRNGMLTYALSDDGEDRSGWPT